MDKLGGGDSAHRDCAHCSPPLCLDAAGCRNARALRSPVVLFGSLFDAVVSRGRCYLQRALAFIFSLLEFVAVMPPASVFRAVATRA